MGNPNVAMRACGHRHNVTNNFLRVLDANLGGPKGCLVGEREGRREEGDPQGLRGRRSHPRLHAGSMRQTWAAVEKRVGF